MIDGRTHVWAVRQQDGQTIVKLWYEINFPFFSNDKSGYNKGQVFQSNMSKNTVDGNCMTKIMLIVMFSTNPAIREKNIPINQKKKINKNILLFLYFTGFEPVTSGFLFSSLICVKRTKPLSYFGPLIYRYKIHQNRYEVQS